MMFSEPKMHKREKTSCLWVSRSKALITKLIGEAKLESLSSVSSGLWNRIR